MYLRITAARGLGLLGEPPAEALPGLIGLLGERLVYARLQAAHTLGLLGPEAGAAAPALGEQLISPTYAVRLEATRALVAIGDKGVEQLIRALANEKAWVRGEIASELGEIDPLPFPAQNALTMLLTGDPVWTVRLEAAVALARSGLSPRRPIRVLVASLRLGDEYDRIWAAEALLRTGPDRVRAWIEVLGSKKIDFVVKVARVVAEIKGRSTEEIVTVTAANARQLFGITDEEP